MREGEPTGEVIHKGDQLLALFNMGQFGTEPIDIDDGNGPVHQARDYPYICVPKARAMIDAMLNIGESDPRRPMILEVGAREMAKRLDLVPDPKNKGGWIKADGKPAAGSF